MGMKVTYLNIIKAFYDKSTANIILNGEKLKATSLRSRMPTLAPLIQQSIGNPRQSNQARKTKGSKLEEKK